MKAVEEYIKEHTRITYNYNSYEQDPIPWLTPNDAKEVSQIAREETIKEVCEWLDNHTMLSEKWYIEDLKKHLKGKRNDIRRHQISTDYCYNKGW